MTAGWFLPRGRFGDLLDALAEGGRTLIGPTFEPTAIVHGEVTAVDDFPAGWGDEHAPGRYRLVRRADDRLFANVVGPTSWKQCLFPPRLPRATGTRDTSTISFREVASETGPVAFIGVRACDLAAMGVHDRVFQQGDHTDGHYRRQRENAFIVAVQCTNAAETCFCASMDTGPEVRTGFDLALTELEDGFVVTAGSDAGHAILDALQIDHATNEHTGAARFAVRRTREEIETRNPGIDAADVAQRLSARPRHPRWTETAARCLACTNCTMVCPTCFCSHDVHTSDLTGESTAMERRWDSCFTLPFAGVAGGNFRSHVRDRYRQWLTHKFSTWFEQFGTTGCVGCGRCIVWCPVGIDVREEIAAVVVDAHSSGQIEIDSTLSEDPPPWSSEPAPHPVPGSPGADREGSDVQSRLPAGAGVDIGVPVTATVIDRHRETADTVTLTIQTPSVPLGAEPGQFVMATLPGIGAPPISFSRFSDTRFELTIRSAGGATKTLCALRAGSELGISGPYGNSWPIAAAAGRDVVVVGGGIGLAPVRPVIDAVLANRDNFQAVRVYVGARTPDDVIFGNEMAELAERSDIEICRIVDRTGPGWTEAVGVVTQLFDLVSWDGPNTTAFVCGPQRMMQATVDVMCEKGVPQSTIFLTTERHMECGVGLCGHCQLGPYFVCRDGPIFTAAQLDRYLGLEGI